MADIQATLSKKVGPLPVWGWAAAAGGLVSVIYLARRGSAMGAPSATSDGQTSPFTASPIIVTPQSLPPSTSSANPGPTPATVPTMAVIKAEFPPNQAWIMSGPGTGVRLASLPDGTTVPVTGTPVTGPADHPNRAWYPITWGGLPGYVNAGDIGSFTGGASGMGGSSSVMQFVPGSGGGKLLRNVGPHAHQQYLATGGMGGGVQTGPWAQEPRRGMAVKQGQNIVGGMGGGGHARLQAVSQKTGLPMTRLMSLNPPWKRRGHVHIA